MNRKRIATHQTGFSLIEALIAALVVGIGLLGLARLQSSFFIDIGESRVQNAALHFAQRQMEEELRAAESKSVFDGMLASPGQNFCAPDEECKGINAELTRSWTPRPCAPDATLPCKVIDLAVSWVDSAGKNADVSLVSYIAFTEPVEAGIAVANLTP